MEWQPASDIPKVLYCDFDGTVIYNAWPRTGKEKPHAVEVLKNLVAHGWRIVLWTARESNSHLRKDIERDVLEEAILWFRDRDIPLAAINETPSDLERRPLGLHRKPIRGYYLDDRAVGGIPKWKEVERLLLGEGK